MSKTINLLCEITSETEKAYKIRAEIIVGGGLEKSAIFWVPKSYSNIVDGGIEVASWLLRKREEELSEKFGGREVLFTSFRMMSAADIA